MVIQVARLFDLMGRNYYYSNEMLPLMYTVLRFLNVAEKAGTSPELASAYSGMAILTRFPGLYSLTEIYVDRSIAVAEEVNQPSNLVKVSFLISLYEITIGKWDEVRTRMEQAKALCEQLGNHPQWGECAKLLGDSALIAGDIQYAMNIYSMLLEDARRWRSPLHESWGLLGVAENNIRLGNAVSAVPMLEEALQILEENPNLASSINTNGQLALAYLRLGQDDKALIYAGKVLDLAANKSPTFYSMNIGFAVVIGFAGVAEVYFEVWEKALQNPI